jgi:hypothetical protein
MIKKSFEVLGSGILLLAEGLDAIVEHTLDLPLSYLEKEATAKALKNPIYAEIESRRKSESGHVVFFSEARGLGLDEWKTQRDIRESCQRYPRLTNLLYATGRFSFSSKLRAIKYGYQRLFRGWDDTTIWSLDTRFCKTLGEQLIELARVSHGWPDTLYDTPEEWVSELTINGGYLLAYGRGDDEIEDLSEEGESRNLLNAKSALIWVSAHLPALWD